MIIHLKSIYRIKRFHADGTIDYFAGTENYEFQFSDKRSSYLFSSAQVAQDILIKLRKREMQKAKFRPRFLYEFESSLAKDQAKCHGYNAKCAQAQEL
jgi:hypothetical protein